MLIIVKAVFLFMMSPFLYELKNCRLSQSSATENSIWIPRSPPRAIAPQPAVDSSSAEPPPSHAA
jgi:hypothetical protein